MINAERGVNAECGVRNAESAGHLPARADLRTRTKAFALAVVRMVNEFPRTPTGRVIGDQLLRSGTSVAANYRAACRARSRREFIARMGVVEEEADEAQFWLELVVELRLCDPTRAAALGHEAGELVAIAVSSIRTARRGSPTIPHSTLRIPHSP